MNCDSNSRLVVDEDDSGLKGLRYSQLLKYVGHGSLRIFEEMINWFFCLQWPSSLLYCIYSCFFSIGRWVGYWVKKSIFFNNKSAFAFAILPLLWARKVVTMHILGSLALAYHRFVYYHNLIYIDSLYIKLSSPSAFSTHRCRSGHPPLIISQVRMVPVITSESYI